MLQIGWEVGVEVIIDTGIFDSGADSGTGHERTYYTRCNVTTPPTAASIIWIVSGLYRCYLTLWPHLGSADTLSRNSKTLPSHESLTIPLSIHPEKGREVHYVCSCPSNDNYRIVHIPICFQSLTFSTDTLAIYLSIGNISACEWLLLYSSSPKQSTTMKGSHPNLDQTSTSVNHAASPHDLVAKSIR